MNSKQIASYILTLVKQGKVVYVGNTPGAIKSAFNSEVHDFYTAYQILKHEMKVLINSGAGYRLATKCHSWVPDVYVFYTDLVSDKEVVSHVNRPDRTGGRKRKGSQWELYEQQEKRRKVKEKARTE